MKGHGIYDKAEYRTQDEVAHWSGKDPVMLFERFLEKEGIVKGTEVENLRSEVDRELEDAIKKARASPVPEFSSLQGLVYPGGDGGK